ncbi:hypothetical protein DFJ74DRAFT_345192 [Hyaloraphidium curvatum]|nr:hypothetical protein DFJ74DRAFT_345192 [Hyaloraphidium curvatum]
MSTPAPNRKRKAQDAATADATPAGTPAARSARKRRRSEPAPECPLESIPPELHRIIFSYLPLVDLYTVSKLSKGFRASGLLLESVKLRMPYLLVDVLRKAGTDYSVFFGEKPPPPANKYFDQPQDDREGEGDGEEPAPGGQHTPPAPKSPVQTPAAATPAAQPSQINLPPPGAADLAAFWSGVGRFVKYFLAPVVRKSRRMAGGVMGEKVLMAALERIPKFEMPTDVQWDPEEYKRIVRELPTRFSELGRLLAEHGALSEFTNVLDMLDSMQQCWSDEHEANHQDGDFTFWPFDFAAPVFHWVDWDKYKLRRFVERLWSMAQDQIDSAHQVLEHVAGFLLGTDLPKPLVKYACDRFHKDGILEDIRRIWRKRLFHFVFPDEKEKEEQRAKENAGEDGDGGVSEWSQSSDTEGGQEEGTDWDSSSGTFEEEMSDLSDFSGSEHSSDFGSEPADWEEGQEGVDWEGEDGSGSSDGDHVDWEAGDGDDGEGLGPYFGHHHHDQADDGDFVAEELADDEGSDAEPQAQIEVLEGDEGSPDDSGWETDEEAA